MGGRGTWSRTAARMPNMNKAIIRRSKISNYLLNPKKSADKQRFFADLGYNMRNQARLQKDIMEAMKDARVRISEPNRFGTVHYQANIEIGINKKSKVVVGWIVRKGSSEPELSTARPYRGKRDDF